LSHKFAAISNEMKNSKLIPILLTSAFVTSCGVGSIDCGANSAFFGLAFCETGKPNIWNKYAGTYTRCRNLWEINLSSNNSLSGTQKSTELSKETILEKYIFNLAGDNQVNLDFTQDYYESNNCSGSPFASLKLSSPILLNYKNASNTPVLLNIDRTSKIQNLSIDFATANIPKITQSLSGPKLMKGCYNSLDIAGNIQASICESNTTSEASSGELAFYLTGKNLFPLSYSNSVWQSEPYYSGYTKQ